MNRKISGAAYRIAFDEIRLRFFLLRQRSVGVFDAETNDKVASLNDIANANQIYISQKNNIIVVKSTVGEFAFYSADTLTLLGKVKLRRCHNTDQDFYYDEDENIVCGTYYWGNEDFIYIVSPQTLTYSVIPFRALKGRTREGDIPVIRLGLHKYRKGSFYLICNFYDVGEKPRIYECFYGRYERDGDTLVLKEKIFSSADRHLKLVDVTEKREDIDGFYQTFGTKEALSHTYRNARGLFFITQDAVSLLFYKFIYYTA